MSRWFVLPLALCLCVGCDSSNSESDEADQSNAGGEGTGLVGGLLIAPSDAVDNVSGGGTIDGGNNPAPQNVPAQSQDDVIQPERPADLVDKNAALAANPDWIEVNNDVEAGDYLTAIADSYFSMSSRVHLLALQHELELERNLNPDYEYPSFETFKEALQRHNVELKGLRANQVYAYDQSTGTVCILEDPTP